MWFLAFFVISNVLFGFFLCQPLFEFLEIHRVVLSEVFREFLLLKPQNKLFGSQAPILGRKGSRNCDSSLKGRFLSNLRFWGGFLR